MDYEFQKEEVGFEGEGSPFGSVDGYKLSSSMPFVSGGLTTFLNSFFIDLYLQSAFSGSDNFNNKKNANLEEEVDSYFERDEYSLSIGYGLGEHWAVFGGYRESTTNFSTLEISTRGLFTGRSVADADFVQDGYFLGATYALPIGEQSMILFNTALAFLDGKFTSSEKYNSSNVYPDGHETLGVTRSAQAQFDGDTEGLNLGIAWKGRLNSSFGYSLEANGYTYDFEGASRERKGKESSNEEVEFIQVDRTLSETVWRLSAGLSYEF
jgi:hypothetical protein